MNPNEVNMAIGLFVDGAIGSIILSLFWKGLKGIGVMIGSIVSGTAGVTIYLLLWKVFEARLKSE